MASVFQRCSGTLSRRAFVSVGLSGICSLSLPDLFRLQAQAGTSPGRKQKSLLVLWLWGGPSHLETFDMKPDAPLEYRGDFKPIPTNVPGIQISEHLPRIARLADKFAILRSVHHDSPGHVNSTHSLVTAYPGDLVETPPYRPKHPDIWSVATKMLGSRSDGVPAYLAIPRTRYHGSAYLGAGLDPLVVASDPNSPNFRPPEVTVDEAMRPRFHDRMDLLRNFDSLRTDLDSIAETHALSRFQQQAAQVLTSDAARLAFDLNREDARVRDRYGRHEVGQRCLLARRLIEAGARVVNVDFPYVPGQKAKSWDDHASVWNIFEEMRARLPVLDQVVSAMIEDLHQRGLQDDVLLLVMGEMSHTPKLSNVNGQPGRDHWGRAMSVFMSGGGMPMGQVVGSTNARGEEPRDRPISPNDFQATLYQYLGIPLDTMFTDQSGRPVPLLPAGTPLRELVS